MFKLLAIETNVDVYPPIFKGSTYTCVDEVTVAGHAGGFVTPYYVIEVEEYDHLIAWGSPSTHTKRYSVPAYLFTRLEADKPKCTCGLDNTWLHFHKRKCPPNKHSDWCEVYQK